MAGTLKIFVLGAMLISAFGNASVAGVIPHLNVIVRFSAGLQNELVTDAEAAAAHVFDRAGVGLQWRNCPARDGEFLNAGCQGTVALTEVVLQIVPRAQRAKDSVFGVAFVDNAGGVYADIFFDRVQRIHDENRTISIATLLGYVMAHEIGHLLLGEHSHVPAGVMLGQWHRDELNRIGKGSLFFDSREAGRLRTRVFELESREIIAMISAESGN